MTDDLWICGASPDKRCEVQLVGADSLKRLEFLPDKSLLGGLGPILAAQEIKPTWHPIAF